MPSTASDAAARVGDPFVHRARTGRPWVITKWAQTADGRIASQPGAPRWISNELSRARVHRLRGRVDAILTGVGTVRADDPIYMLTAPIPATRHALEKAGMSLDGIDLIEINEAFAPVVLAWQKETGADLAKVNVNGGAIALGHPIGATGTRLMTTLLAELDASGDTGGR